MRHCWGLFSLYRDALKRGDTKAIAEMRNVALTFLDFYWPGDVARAKAIRLTKEGFR